MTVRFLIRRDDPTLFFGRFTAVDLVFLFLSLFPPWPLFLLTPIPLPLCIAFSVLPTVFYVIRFRVGKPRGYFLHWLRFRLRPKLWRTSTTYADSLLGARNRWLLCARPLPGPNGDHEVWQGVGFPRLSDEKLRSLAERDGGAED